MQLVGENYQLTGEIDPLYLVNKYGAPLYVYDTSIIASQYKRLSTAFDVPSLRINFACKALTNLAILKFMNSLGAGLDTVSIEEVRLGIAAGFDPHNIIFTPNCVSVEEIELAIEAGVRINIDNISTLEQIGTRHPGLPVCIRVNPHIMAGGNSKISTGHIDSKFGISIHQMPHVLRIVDAIGMKIEGVHMHTGSDILDVDVFLAGAEILLKIAKHFKHLDYIDFGSGFKVPYKRDDIYTDIEELGEKISKRFRTFCTQYGRDLTLMFEPGKFLVSESGYFFAKVNVIKQTTSTVFAGIDSGMNHLIRPMFYNSHHTILNVSNPTGKPRIYTVVGYICETDTFGANRLIPQLQEDDIICFLNAGAYCFTMASNYNSRLRPAEVLIHNGKDYLIRKRETIEDLMRNQVDLDIFKNEHEHA